MRDDLNAPDGVSAIVLHCLKYESCRIVSDPHVGVAEKLSQQPTRILTTCGLIK